MNGARFIASVGVCTAVSLAGCGRAETRSAGDSISSATGVGAQPGSQPATPRAGARAQDRRTIVFAGTSLTAGLGLDPDSAYPHLIQRKIDSAGLDFETVNAGVSG